MHPFDDYVRTETRRHFLGRGANGLGLAALASLMGRAASGQEPGCDRPPLRPHGQARHLPAHGRRSLANGHVRLQARDERLVRQGPPRQRPPGPAPHHHDQRPGPLPHRPVEIQVRPARRVRHVDDRAICPIPREWSTTSASSAACTPRPSTTNPPSASCRPATWSPAAPASARGPATAWAPRTTTCPPSSSSSPGPPITSKTRPSPAASGPPASSPASTPASPSAPAATPSSSSRTPPACPRDVRRETLDGLNALNQLTYAELGDPETRTRIEQYEMAFRMQSSVPDLTDIADEPASTEALYGPDIHKSGSFAHSALLARRMVERGVRFVQIYHNNWDHHANVSGRMPDQCRDVDQPCWGLIQDLKSRGLLRRHPRHLGRRIRPHHL